LVVAADVVTNCTFVNVGTHGRRWGCSGAADTGGCIAGLPGACSPLRPNRGKLARERKPPFALARDGSRVTFLILNGHLVVFECVSCLLVLLGLWYFRLQRTQHNGWLVKRYCCNSNSPKGWFYD
jgi:hypothetical protein